MGIASVPPQFDTGGNSGQRGYEFQAYSLLYYFLTRHLKYQELEMHVETYEDAWLLYEPGRADAPQELVQCKTRTDSDSSSLRPHSPSESLPLGQFAPGDLRAWLQKERHGRSLAYQMTGSPNLFCTFLLLGELSSHLSAYEPNSQSIFPFGHALNSRFPPEYRHQGDPARRPKDRFASDEIRRRVRILRAGTPFELEFWCQQVLCYFYNVSATDAGITISELIGRYRRCATPPDPADPASRVFKPSHLREVIASHQRGSGSWISGVTWLQMGDDAVLRRPALMTPKWSDYYERRVIELPQYRDALAALETNPVLLIHGYTGAGKTTLAGFMVYSWLTSRANGVVYYLPVSPGAVLEDELVFFEANLRGNALFILDDAQFAAGEVKKFVRVLQDQSFCRDIAVRLVVTTNDTYTPRMLGGQKGADDPLTQAMSVGFVRLAIEELQSILEESRRRWGTDSLAVCGRAARLARGQLGLAVIILQALDELGPLSNLRLLGSQKAFQLLRRWVLARCQQTDDSDVFERDYVPVFIMDAFAINLTETVTRAFSGVLALRSAGLVRGDPGDNPRFSMTGRGAETPLSYLVTQHFVEQIPGVMMALLKEEPTLIGLICQRLSQDRFGLPALLRFIQGAEEKIVDALINPYRPLSLRHVSAVLSSTLRIDKEEGRAGRDLLHRLVRQAGRTSFWSTFLSVERAQSLGEIARFFESLFKIDQTLTRALASDCIKLGEDKIQLLVRLSESPVVDLGDIARCLFWSYRCSEAFGTNLYRQLEEIDSFHARIAKATHDLQSLPRLLRYCVMLYRLFRTRIAPILDHSFTVERIEELFLSAADQAHVFLVIDSLRKVRPRVAADCLASIWARYQGKVLSRCAQEASIVDFTNQVKLIRRVSRSVARDVAILMKERAYVLVKSEENYHDAFSTVYLLKQIVGWEYAHELSEAIDQHEVAKGLQNTNQKFGVVGLCLDDCAEINPPMASWLEANLNFRALVERIETYPLYNLSYLLFGFLTAVGSDVRAKRVEQYLGDSVIRDVFSQAWREEKSLAFITLCLSLLNRAGLSQSEVLKLINLDLDMLHTDLTKRLSERRSYSRVADLLYAVCLISDGISESLLISYVEFLESSAPVDPDRTGLKRKGGRDKLGLYRGASDRGNTAQRIMPDHLVGLGQLLRISAAVNPEQALALANAIGLERYVDYAASEKNFGRLSVFVSGLSEVSRLLCHKFLGRSSDTEASMHRSFGEQDDVFGDHDGALVGPGQQLPATLEARALVKGA